MEAKHNINYNFERSLERMDEILNEDNASYQESETIPSRDKLTFKNGVYVNCTALFVDIIDSSDLTNEHRRPILAKIYRSFISEMVALFNGHDTCREVCINGDCVWCVCDTQWKCNIDGVFSLAAQAASLVDILNYKLKKKGYQTYSVGIGIDYGRALMIKAGYSGSEINDVVWMGDVVNNACHLCSEANQRYYDKRIFISNIIYDNLSPENQKFCTKDYGRNIYQVDVVNIKMNEWLTQQESNI